MIIQVIFMCSVDYLKGIPGCVQKNKSLSNYKFIKMTKKSYIYIEDIK